MARRPPRTPMSVEAKIISFTMFPFAGQNDPDEDKDTASRARVAEFLFRVCGYQYERNEGYASGSGTMEHLDESTVLDFLSASLSGVDRSRVEEHIDRCAECRQLISALVQTSAQ